MAWNAKSKFHKVMGEYSSGSLHSGSGGKGKGKVKAKKQALAIAYSEARKFNPRFGKKGR